MPMPTRERQRPTRRLVDLSHPLEEGMTTHPGVPGPAIAPFLTREETASHYAPGVSFEMTRIDMVTSIGTYVDAPGHRHAGLADLAGVPLERYAGLPGVVVDVRGLPSRAVGPEALGGLDVGGCAVLFYSDWSERWNSPAYLEPGPYLTAEACRELVRRGAALTGVDWLNVDDVGDLTRPAHTILLGARLGLVENLCGLGQLPRRGFSFHAAPVAVRGGMVFPVRAYALLDGSPG